MGKLFSTSNVVREIPRIWICNSSSASLLDEKFQKFGYISQSSVNLLDEKFLEYRYVTPNSVNLLRNSYSLGMLQNSVSLLRYSFIPLGLL